MFGLRILRAAVFTAGAVGGLSGAAYGLLTEQSKRARKIIGVPAAPLRADGVYLPDGSGPLAPTDPRITGDPLVFAVLGDSSAAGVGCDTTEELPGVLLARGLAEESEHPVRLLTHAISGATSRELAGQTEAALRTPPDVALVIIGGNDVTARLGPAACALMLGAAVRGLTETGAAVVVGTCPDLGAIRPIAQPLRALVRSWSLTLARAQRRAVQAAGGRPVALADLLSPEFLTRPSELFSKDMFHPSAAGYAAAVGVLLPELCVAARVWDGGPLPAQPTRSAAAEARRPTAKLVAGLNRRLKRVPPATSHSAAVTGQ
ncbi:MULTISPECIES: SGNH/GDSL hydrolase family protein [unclassified Crossiella]|uniref:SGNH/GDSL hydrolase family protein n=1 Tax=unclassified Crossiella TaxID=2620835 RepID=UPI001FFFC039|nr:MULTISPECIES: SGNH/GDSL hydrolase family protein [unclassified Crossiella]MCK2237082.1 SGNH/GDSL hydrolase family protein [Crossiella sp. S99.2]MCK2250750.1 SGNH/GDSL hydrolase family protein [Crossiella sp. S99.1]